MGLVDSILSGQVRNDQAVKFGGGWFALPLRLVFDPISA